MSFRRHYLVLHVIILNLVGCAYPIGKTIQKPISKAAVVVDINSDIVCYRKHATLFTNGSKDSIPLGADWSKDFKKSFEKALIKNNVQYEFFQLSDLGLDNTSIEKIGNSIKAVVIPEHQAVFTQRVSQLNVDAVFILTDVNDPDNTNSCKSAINAAADMYGLFARAPSIGIFTSQGEYSKTLGISAVINSRGIATQPSTLSQQTVSRIYHTLNNTLEDALDNYLSPRIEEQDPFQNW
ncbi:hypothetical protein NBRC116494_01070 [Aurantivibrio plasticivorans]